MLHFTKKKTTLESWILNMTQQKKLQIVRFTSICQRQCPYFLIKLGGKSLYRKRRWKRWKKWISKSYISEIAVTTFLPKPPQLQIQTTKGIIEENENASLNICLNFLPSFQVHMGSLFTAPCFIYSRLAWSWEKYYLEEKKLLKEEGIAL